MCDEDLQCECCSHFNMDSKIPLRVPLSAYYKRSFAFYTVKERLPVILTQIIDHLVRDKEAIIELFGEGAREEIKTVIGELSKLKYEIQTNKPLTELTCHTPDAEIYNRYLLEKAEDDGHPRYFSTIWLYAECYMYRRIRNMLENTNNLTKFDPFRKQKENSFFQSNNAMIVLGEYLLTVVKKGSNVDVKNEFIQLLKLNLWGNKCDMSLSAGKDSSQTSNPFECLAEYDKNILCDHSEQIWEALQNFESSGVINIINDNAGYEIFTDLCLADFLVTFKLANTIVLNFKSIPWYVSDVTPKDFTWMIRELLNNTNESLKKLGIRWNKYLREGVWSHEADTFWTLPFDFTRMKSQSPELYDRLSQSKLLVFKGDLNYRKLFGEINWEASTPVVEALQGFQPAPLCTLRTVKADIVCGLPKGLAERLDQDDPDWKTTGNYGLIQFCSLPSSSSSSLSAS